MAALNEYLMWNWNIMWVDFILWGTISVYATFLQSGRVKYSNLDHCVAW